MRWGGFKLFYLLILYWNSQHPFLNTIMIIKGSIESSWAALGLPACLLTCPGWTPDSRLRWCPASRTLSDVVRADTQHTPPATRNPSTANYKQFPCPGWGEERERESGRKSSCQPKADTHGSVYRLPVVWLCHGNIVLMLTAWIFQSKSGGGRRRGAPWWQSQPLMVFWVGWTFSRRDGSLMHNVEKSHKHASVSLLLSDLSPTPVPLSTSSFCLASRNLPFRNRRGTARRCLIHQSWNVDCSQRKPGASHAMVPWTGKGVREHVRAHTHRAAYLALRKPESQTNTTWSRNLLSDKLFF